MRVRQDRDGTRPGPVVVPECLALDTYVVLRRMQNGLHTYLSCFNGQDDERILYGLFRHAGLLDDLLEVHRRLVDCFAKQYIFEEKTSPMVREVPWPPSFRPELPCLPDVEALDTLSQQLPPERIHHANLAFLTTLRKIFAKFSLEIGLPTHYAHEMKTIEGSLWADYWRYYDSCKPDSFFDPEPPRRLRLKAIEQLLHAMAESKAKHYVQICTAGISVYFGEDEPAPRHKFVQLAQSILQLGDEGATVPVPRSRQWWSPQLSPGIEHPARSAAWDEIRGVLGRSRRGFNWDDSNQELTKRAAEQGLYRGLCDELFLQPCETTMNSPAGQNGSSEDVEKESYDQFYCSDYAPGNLHLSKREALELQVSLETLCQVIQLIITEFEAGHTHEEYFYRVAQSSEYYGALDLYRHLRTILVTQWPEPCMAQYAVLQQMAGRFTVSGGMNCSVEWWGGWEDPEPIPYCDDCDPEGRHVDFPS